MTPFKDTSLTSRIGILLLLFFAIVAQYAQSSESILEIHLGPQVKESLVAVEAEDFDEQSKTEMRQWYRISEGSTIDVGRDDDGPHYDNASGGTYLEILPDTRVTHDDELVHGENFSNEAGLLAVLHYRVSIEKPGRYYVWVRAFSSGTEDNGIHVGLNGDWPEHGQRMQWCEGKNEWTWASKQRTEDQHCGVPGEIYLDIKEAGDHEIQFSMREDGFEFDKFVLTRDSAYVPEGEGPDSIQNR